MSPLGGILFVLVALVLTFLVTYAVAYTILKPIVEFILAPLEDDQNS